MLFKPPACSALVSIGVAVLIGCTPPQDDRQPTLDSRPEYQGLKPPVSSLNTPGTDVQSINVGGRTVRIGQRMSVLFEVLPEPEVEDSEDDPDIQITSPFGTVPGMTYVYRYRLEDGRRVVIRYRRDVPQRPFIGEAGSVQHPFVVSRITLLK